MDALYHSANAALARNWWAIALRGLLAILFGIGAILLPGAALLSLVLLFAAYLVVDGMLAIVSAVRAMAAHERWGLLIAEGICGILLAIAIVLLPLSALLALVWLTAGWAIVTGALLIAAAFRLRAHQGRWWLGLGGLVSVLWGIGFMAFPLLGAFVMAWWIGGYAVAFGVLLIAGAFKLRHSLYSARVAHAPRAA